MSTILYLHGFNSSPQSHKVSQLRDWLARHRPDVLLLAPDIATNAARVAVILREHLEAYPDANLVGSSLGGYYATWASAVFARKAVLINPAVAPYERFHAYLGEQQNLYSGEKYILTTEMAAELQPLEAGHSRSRSGCGYYCSPVMRRWTTVTPWRVTPAVRCWWRRAATTPSTPLRPIFPPLSIF